MLAIRMTNKNMIELAIVWIGSTSTWILTIMDLVISIFVGIGTLIFTAVKLAESYKSFRARLDIQKEEKQNDD